MSIEDDLRATMRAHDHEAPTGLDWTPPETRRRLVLPLLAAAAVVLLAAGGVALLGQDRNDRQHKAARPLDTAAPATTAGCPAKYRSTTSLDGWVPARSEVPGTGRQLVPDRAPDAAVVCGYELGGTSQRSLTNLATIPASLSSAPGNGVRMACAAYATSHDNDNYLLRLRYGARILWVAAPANHCGGSSNGRFVSRDNLSVSAISALKSGRWAIARRPRCEPTNGRSGDQTRLVPSGVTTVDVCVRDKHTRTLTGHDARALATTLGTVDTPSDHMRACLLENPKIRDTVLQFRYRDGPAVTVSFSEACALSASNGQIGRALNFTQYELISRLVT